MKLYDDMTRNEKLKYRTTIAANWVKEGFTFALVCITRKVTNRDGWNWASEWNWKDHNGDMKPIDKDLFYKELGIEEESANPYLAHNLKKNGFDIFDLDEVIVFNPKNYKRK